MSTLQLVASSASPYDYKEGDVHTMSDIIMFWAYIRWLIAELVDDDDSPDNVKNLLNGDGCHM